MQKTTLVTGATDGIGMATAKQLVASGHKVLLHGRNPEKLVQVSKMLSSLPTAGPIETFMADLSSLQQVITLADTVRSRHLKLDILINNAGVYRTDRPSTVDGLDVRFAVNTIAPYLLTRKLLPLMDATGRVINLSSAAQAPVNLEALSGRRQLADMEAYAQSKLAITMWTRELAKELGADGPEVIAVNPGSLLATKTVKDGFGIAGNDIGIGADILVHAALSDAFTAHSGHYFDNDAGRFAEPHPDGLDSQKSADVVRAIETVLTGKLPGKES